MAYLVPAKTGKVWDNQSVEPSTSHDQKQVKTKNPEYAFFEPHLRLAMDCYYGSGGFLNGDHLTKFSIRESPDRYAERQSIAWFPSYVRTIIDVFPNAIFSAGIQRTENIGVELKDLFKSRHGDRNETMRQASVIAKLYGVAIVGIDRPVDIEKGGKPLIEVLNPVDVIDWSLDGDEFEWIKIVKAVPGWRGDPLNPEKKCLERIILWERNKISAWDEIPAGKEKNSEWGKYKPVSGFPRENTLGFVPYFPFWPGNTREEGMLYGSTESLQLARINHRIYNAENEVDTQVRDQTYNLLIWPTEDGNPAAVEVGSNSTAYYNATLGQGPDFISPSSEPIKICQEVIQSRKKDMFQLMRLDFDAGVTPSSVSATQRVYVGEEAAKAMRALSKSAERLEIKLTKALLSYEKNTTALNKTDNPELFQVVYPDSFDRSIMGADFINRLMSLATLVYPSVTANREKAKFIIQNAHAMPNEAKLADIKKEIDESDGIIRVNAANNETTWADRNANQRGADPAPDKIPTLTEKSGLDKVGS